MYARDGPVRTTKAPKKLRKARTTSTSPMSGGGAARPVRPDREP